MCPLLQAKNDYQQLSWRIEMKLRRWVDTGRWPPAKDIRQPRGYIMDCPYSLESPKFDVQASILSRDRLCFIEDNMYKVLLATLALSGLSVARPDVYLIRHGEKPKEGNGLNEDGLDRTECIRYVFGQHSDYNIGLILAQKPKKSESSQCFKLLGVTCCLLLGKHKSLVSE